MNLAIHHIPIIILTWILIRVYEKSDGIFNDEECINYVLSDHMYRDLIQYKDVVLPV